MDVFFGNPTVTRQGKKARDNAAKRRAETLPDPKTYAFLSGLLGEAPDDTLREMQPSVMEPRADAADITTAGERGFGLSILGALAPFLKGLPVGASIKEAIPKHLQGTSLKGLPAKVMNGGQEELYGGFRPAQTAAERVSHAGMFSPMARRAMTTETRGQNSWVNFGPYAQRNRTASPIDTEYAPQKIGLLPEWAAEEGFAGARLPRYLLED